MFLQQVYSRSAIKALGYPTAQKGQVEIAPVAISFFFTSAFMFRGRDAPRGRYGNAAFIRRRALFLFHSMRTFLPALSSAQHHAQGDTSLCLRLGSCSKEENKLVPRKLTRKTSCFLFLSWPSIRCCTQICAKGIERMS